MLKRLLIGTGFLGIGLALSACQIPVTPDGTPYTDSSPGVGQITVTAASTSGGDNREIDFSPNTAQEADATECAVWQSGQGGAQDALAFDITRLGGGIQAITIERNMWENDFGYFVAVTWDSTSWTNVILDGNVDLSSYLGTTNVFPLTVCARMVGNMIQFEVAKQGDTIQPWGNTTQGGSIGIVTPQYLVPGYTGVYFGHLPAGTSATDTNITIDGQPASVTS